MSAPTLQSTLMLTEHLQYPAVSLVDDIINAVNEIMYKCTAAMEKYLLEKHEIEGKDYTEEIKIGIAKLETLLESSVDKNFDKLELYVLRNVLRIPQELLDANVFRLKYQRDLVIASESQRQQKVKELDLKVQQIEQAFERNKRLRYRIQNAKRLKVKMQKLKVLLREIMEGKSTEIQEIVNSLKPIDDSLKLVTSQLKEMYLDGEKFGSMEKIYDVSKLLRQRNDTRTDYIEARTKNILQDLCTNSNEITDDNNSLDTPQYVSDKHIDIKMPNLAGLD